MEEILDYNSNIKKYEKNFNNNYDIIIFCNNWLQ